MYPLDYPMDAIGISGSQRVLDPFCGRGTTNMAARLNGIFSVGIDSSRVAYAISSAKMVKVTPADVVSECDRILESCSETEIPTGEFWSMMYDTQVLKDICSLRKALLEDCRSSERIALRGIIMGILHGPMNSKGTTSYLSNQFPRTFASKPAYSVKYWKSRNMTRAPKVNLRETVNRRAYWCYSEDYGPTNGFIVKGDSTDPYTFYEVRKELNGDYFDTVITSPPYHGLNTYIPDQWIRNWFVGGPDVVEYTSGGQTSSRLSTFKDQLFSVWSNCESVCKDGSRMFVRFGDIKDEDPQEVIMDTFEGTRWKVQEIRGAGRPIRGRRTSELFVKSGLREYKEIDVVAVLS